MHRAESMAYVILILLSSVKWSSRSMCQLKSKHESGAYIKYLYQKLYQIVCTGRITLSIFNYNNRSWLRFEALRSFFLCQGFLKFKKLKTNWFCMEIILPALKAPASRKVSKLDTRTDNMKIKEIFVSNVLHTYTQVTINLRIFELSVLPSKTENVEVKVPYS